MAKQFTFLMSTVSTLANSPQEVPYEEGENMLRAVNNVGKFMDSNDICARMNECQVRKDYILFLRLKNAE